MISLALDAMPLPRQFLFWWLGRLRELIPAPAKRLLSGPERILLVDLSAGPAQLVRLVNGREVGRLEVANAGGEDSIRHAASQLGNIDKVRLRLARGQVLRRRVVLPLAIEEDLGAAIGFELDRLTPFRHKDVHLAYDVDSRDRAAGRLTLDLRVTPKSTIDGALAKLRGWGLPADRIEVVCSEDTTAVIAIDASRRRRKLVRWHAGLNWILAPALILLAVYWQYGEYVARQERLADLRSEFAELEPVAEETLVLLAAIEQHKARRDALHQRRRATPLALALLNEIAVHLPDHTWLVRATMDNGRIEIVGYSPAVSEIVAAFTTSPLFDSVTYESPVTREPRDELDQFHLGLTIASERTATEIDS